jgi:succinate dehydrogenase / fumarate reductase cytochrome b subunit
LPLPGVVSILHRISGVLMVLAIPILAYLFALSLRDAEGFAAAARVFDAVWIKLSLMIMAWSLAHHLFAGIRFALLDFDVGIDKPRARQSSWLVFVLSILTTLVLWGVIW